MPIVSVIVPNYNHAPYLRKRVDSILAQTYQDFELILLDDCSTDSSREILSLYADNPKVRMEFNEKNSGSPFKQWNKGVRKARGHYVWIAESDDYADRQFLERMVRILDGNDRVTFAYCRSWVVREDDQVYGFADTYLDRWDAAHWKADFLVDGTEECRRFFVLTNPVCNASAVVFRKNAYERAGEADESLRLCGDYKLWATLALGGKIAYLCEPLNYYRTHSESVRTRTGADGLGLAEFFCVARWIVRRIAPSGTLPRSMQVNRPLDRSPSGLAPHERIRACIESISQLSDWYLRHNSHLSNDMVRERFKEWQLALYETEFALSPPSRWRFFLYKCKFYGYYFPTINWKLRVANLIRLIGATALGYRRRHDPERTYVRVVQLLETLRRRY